MKWLFLPLTLILLIGLFGNSHENLAEAKEENSYPKILLQLVLRNSDCTRSSRIRGPTVDRVVPVTGGYAARGIA